MTRAEELLKRIRDGGGAQEIILMINQHFTEELFLDYKQSATVAGARGLSDSDRKNFGKAISGFGNSEGGLLVWGVQCQQGANGDIPTAPTHVPNALAFKTLLDGAVGGITIPAHRSVENFAFPDDGKPGFVVSHVPPGYDLPIAVAMKAANGFYLRAGSSFEPVTPGLLGGMFGRRPNPQLTLVITPRFAFLRAAATSTQFTLAVSALNRGRGIGERVYLTIEGRDGNGFEIISIPPENTWTRLPTHLGTRVYFADTLKFPPTSTIRLMDIVVQINSRVSEQLALKLHLGVDGGYGDEKEIELLPNTLNLIHEHLAAGYPPGVHQEAAIETMLETLRAEEKSQQRNFFAF